MATDSGEMYSVNTFASLSAHWSNKETSARMLSSAWPLSAVRLIARLLSHTFRYSSMVGVEEGMYLQTASDDDSVIYVPINIIKDNGRMVMQGYVQWSPYTVMSWILLLAGFEIGTSWFALGSADYSATQTLVGMTCVLQMLLRIDDDLPIGCLVDGCSHTFSWWINLPSL